MSFDEQSFRDDHMKKGRMELIALCKERDISSKGTKITLGKRILSDIPVNNLAAYWKAQNESPRVKKHRSVSFSDSEVKAPFSDSLRMLFSRLSKYQEKFVKPPNSGRSTGPPSPKS